MTNDELINKIGLATWWRAARRVNEEAGVPPDHSHTGEEQAQCLECRAWRENFEAIWQKVFGPLENEGEK
jgi:hypothetical protein